MKKTKHLTFCALMSALGAIALLLGGITRVLDLTAVVIGAMIIFVVFTELKYSALAVYAVTALLAFILPIEKTVAVEYLIFAIYPILKPLFERAGRVFGLAIKLIFMIISSASLVLIFRFVFMMVDLWYIDLIFAIGLVACYFLFDVALTRFKLYYQFKLRHQLKIDRFFH
ncbi:MAG: hypothetical protein J6A53_00980 [Clostridia bacterium]|nr:hypothetical protein [Clostridia bacterium]